MCEIKSNILTWILRQLWCYSWNLTTIYNSSREKKNMKINEKSLLASTQKQCFISYFCILYWSFCVRGNNRFVWTLHTIKNICTRVYLIIINNKRNAIDWLMNGRRCTLFERNDIKWNNIHLNKKNQIKNQTTNECGYCFSIVVSIFQWFCFVCFFFYPLFTFMSFVLSFVITLAHRG